ncbi:MAG: glycerophosphodiester phosphodiesterase [Gemmatimonadales bacterium]
MRQQAATPEAIAHRGLRDKYPENSVPAFLASLEAGVDAIELDVHATRDKVVVVHHDPVLGGRSISTIDSTDLATCELSPGVIVPTLAGVLRAMAPRATVYVEIKAPGIESLVADVLRAAPQAPGKFAVHSFDHRIVRKFGSLAPDVPTGILLVGYPVDSVSLLKAAHARDLWQQCEFIDAALVDSIHAADGRVIAWTCNEAADWARLRDLGVDGICTDRSPALVEWLAR